MNAQEYKNFLASKQSTIHTLGFNVTSDMINPMLFKFQNAIVIWALRLGKAATFLECGMGKTFIQLEWARLVYEHTGNQVLILAPLAVSGQTIREGEKLGIPVIYAKSQEDVGSHPVVVTNYERLANFDTETFVGIVLDESSILKSFMGKTRKAIIEAFKATPYKLACTATPAPNDYVELGNHAEFLNIKTRTEMLSTWFINDSAHTGDWRLKKHAAKDFWRWLTSWAVCMSKPADLGTEYDMLDFVLPSLNIVEHRLGFSQATIQRNWDDGRLIPDNAPSSTQLHKVKRESLDERVETAQAIVANISDDDAIILWCDTNDEADALMKAFPEAVEVRGNHTVEQKENKLLSFTDGNKRIIITKTEIAGFGLNWQHCAHQIFVGVSYSFEKTYQALRRSWRFGQKNQVNAYMIYSEAEGNVVTVLNQKQMEFKKMQQAMNEATQEFGLIRDADRAIVNIGEGNATEGQSFTLYHGDCVLEIEKVASDSIGLSVYSPPFPDIFSYSDAPQDMGNSANDDEFFEHYKRLIPDMLRVTIPGRLSCVHCIDLPNFKYKHGTGGLRDFPGRIIQAHIDAGWMYHSRITIWKDPVTEMQRSKAHGLLHKNFAAQSEHVRQGLPDYVLVFRKPGDENGIPVIQHREIGDYVGTQPPRFEDMNGYGKSLMTSYSISVWQRYASPVWFDIDQTRTLNYRAGKESNDEKHICPLQLDVIERCIDLWSNKGDVVLSPFAGIGSEGVSAITMGRKFIGIEFKQTYHTLASRYLIEAENLAHQPTLFDLMPAGS